ncbi:MAG: hypothetical protein AAFY71_12210 [Bacteroidota bacterium]
MTDRGTGLEEPHYLSALNIIWFFVIYVFEARMYLPYIEFILSLLSIREERRKKDCF